MIFFGGYVWPNFTDPSSQLMIVNDAIAWCKATDYVDMVLYQKLPNQTKFNVTEAKIYIYGQYRARK